MSDQSIGDPAEVNKPVERQIIVVDLDRTLSLTDTLHEQLLKLLFEHPSLLAGMIGSLGGGRAALKAYCARHVALDPSALLYCEEVLAYIRSERVKGSYVVLCSAADRRVAQTVADHLGLFDEVMATEHGSNLKGPQKAAALAARFPQGFVYAGDHTSDLAVWARSTGIVLVGASARLTRRAEALGRPVLAQLRPLHTRPPAWRIWVKALRIHQWSKNVLIFVPLFLAHQWSNPRIVTETIIAFLLLLVVTSSTYLLNDLADIDADRRHQIKRQRPIASGALPASHAGIVATVALVVAVGAGFLLNLSFGAALVSYVVLTLAYSLRLKRIPLLDVLVVATLFTTRLAMGAAFLVDALPVWLTTFSMFLFFSLAMAKRHTEVLRARHHNDSIKSRGYQPEDWPLTLNLGVSSGIASLIILVLYLVSESFRTVGYSRPDFLWPIIVCVGIWIGRIWLLTHRGEMHDDPVNFALRDRASWLVAAAIAVCFALAI